MQVNFVKEQQKLLNGLRMKYFQFIMMKCMSFKKKARKEAEEEIEEKTKKRKANKEEQEEIFPVDFDNEAIQKEQDKKTLSPDEVIKSMINKEGLSINKQLFKKYFKVESPNVMHKVLSETNNNNNKKKISRYI